jgi:6-phosphofructokinase
MASGKILVAQGGGPTAVINQSLVGVALEARRFGAIERIYGARHGVRGIVSSALGSMRDKPDLAYCQEIFKVLRAHQIEHFFYIGGNDSSDTVRIVSLEAQKAGYPLRCLHIPKTIDNDLVGNDHTPGFPSAARFVAQAFAGANLDNAALPGVYVGVVMGRHAGFLTAASALGEKISRRRPAPDLRARAHLCAGEISGGCKSRVRALRSLRHCGVRRHSRCIGHPDCLPAGQGFGARCPRQRAALGQRRTG